MGRVEKYTFQGFLSISLRHKNLDIKVQAVYKNEIQKPLKLISEIITRPFQSMI